MEYRIEKDTMGEMRVPADKYWGAQTERSHENFLIGGEVMPREITRAFGYLKKAAANANCRLGVISEEKRAAIADACDKVISGELNEHFPLVVWQTGSGTQSNMNANEVIANYANDKAGKKLLHPNDDVNKSQSSNDTFPTAMHVAATLVIEEKLLPAVDTLISTFRRLEKENEGIVKSGRTHLQDAVPIAFSQEISGWRNMLEKTRGMISYTLGGLSELALGGTAVGTGLNAPKGPRRPRRNLHSRKRTGFFDYAGQGKPHAVRSGYDGSRAGDGQRRRRGICGFAGEFRTERIHARDSLQLPAVGKSACRFDHVVRKELRARN